MYIVKVVYEQDRSLTFSPKDSNLLREAAFEAGGRTIGTRRAIQSAKAAGNKVLEVEFSDKEAADSFKEELETSKPPFTIRFIRITVTKSRED